MDPSTKLLVSIVGPTAVGKTAIGITLAKFFNTEILSVDSRQLYKEMTIGTAKPSSEELRQVRHHFIDHLSIQTGYTAADFEREAVELLDTLFKKRDIVIAVGGTGLFFKAIWDGFDEIPEVEEERREELNQELMEFGLQRLVSELQETDPIYFEQVDRNNPQRVIRALEVIRSTGVPYSSFRKGVKKDRSFRVLKIGLELDREVLYQRIDTRMDLMLKSGLVDEARSLYPYKDLNALRTVGYQEIFGFFDGAYDFTEAVRLLKQNSRRYAKRQMTWFKKDPEIEWHSPSEIERIIERIKGFTI